MTTTKKEDKDTFKPTPQMEWVLSGVFLGYTLVVHPDKARNCYTFITPTGEIKDILNVPSEKVNELYTNGYLAFHIVTSTFRLTNIGFEYACDYLQKRIGSPSSENFVG